MSHCLGYAQRSETFYIEGETRNVKIFNHLFSNKFSRNFPVNTEKNEMATLIIYEIINPNSARTQPQTSMHLSLIQIHYLRR